MVLDLMCVPRRLHLIFKRLLERCAWAERFIFECIDPSQPAPPPPPRTLRKVMYGPPIPTWQEQEGLFQQKRPDILWRLVRSVSEAGE